MTCSMVMPGTIWLCECIIVSMTTVSPELTRSTGAWALSNQPHCVVAGVAGRRCVRGFRPTVPEATMPLSCNGP